MCNSFKKDRRATQRYYTSRNDPTTPLVSMKDDFEIEKLRELELWEVGILFGVAPPPPYPGIYL